MVFIDTLFISVGVVLRGWDFYPPNTKADAWGCKCFPPHIMNSIHSKIIRRGDQQKYTIQTNGYIMDRIKNEINLRFVTVPTFFHQMQPVINSILLCLLYNKEKDFCHNVNNFNPTFSPTIPFTSSPSSL